jgi:hypothetical protein
VHGRSIGGDGKGKLFDDDGHAPAALAKQFDGTFIATFPGIDTRWLILGVLELLIIMLLVLRLSPGAAREPTP